MSGQTTIYSVTTLRLLLNRLLLSSQEQCQLEDAEETGAEGDEAEVVEEVTFKAAAA